MKQEEYPLLGLHCAGCASRAEEVLRKHKGVEVASVNLATASASIRYDEASVSPEDLAKAIAIAGYQLVVEYEYQDEESLEKLRVRELLHLRSRAITALLASALLMLSMHWGHLWQVAMIQAIFSTMILVGCGADFYRRAWRQLRQGGMGMDTLVALSTSVAYLYSLVLLFSASDHIPHLYFESAVMILAFVLLGKYLEARAKGNTTEAIKRLSGLQPKTVLRRSHSGEQSEVSIYDLLLGDRVVVRAGERIAVDGIVSEGESYVDVSMLTGEVLPIKRQEGDEVFAGSINQNGSLVVRTTALHRDTLLGRITQRVRSAQGSKAPVQRMVDKVAAIFVPIILVLSALTLILWISLGGSNAWEQGLVSAVTVLVVACPCALGLATPTAIMVGIGRAAEEGILIKDAESLELAKTVDTIVFDKTGTLTLGKPRMLDLSLLDEGLDLSEVQKRLRSIESRSHHPIAQAILSAVAEVELLSLDHWENVAGRGIRATIEGVEHYLGNEAFMLESGINIGKPAQVLKEKYSTDLGASPIYLAWGGRLRAMLAVADEIKEGVHTLVDNLKQQGIEIHLLSGDARSSVERLGKTLGIEHIRAEVLPTDKADYIRMLTSQGRRVAMLGDGINDSAALAEATLSVAMGTGSDIAIESAQATIISGDIRLLPRLLRLSMATISTIHQNLFWAFGYNLLALPLAAGLFYPYFGWHLTPGIASMLMAMSSISVVLNSLRLRRTRL